jgi:hypothetical protein
MTAPDKPLHERIAEYVKRPTHWNYEANALLSEAAEALREAEKAKDAAVQLWNDCGQDLRRN